MSEVVLRGAGASPGLTAGSARVLRPLSEALAGAGEPADDPEREAERARRALADAARKLDALAASLREDGRASEAEIVETGSLMAADPLLEEAVVAAVRNGGLAAPAALLEATEAHATAIAALPDETLAARADDVRSLGRRAARLATGGSPDEPAPSSGFVLVAEDLGPADVAELGGSALGFALAAGAVTAHAAIVARSLGIPMAVELGGAAFDAADGLQVVLDGDGGLLVLQPEPERLARAGEAVARRRDLRARARAKNGLPAQTSDGRRIRVLVNAASAAEVAAGLEAGAEGAGLIRTELAFLDARQWPSEKQHARTLAPVLECLGGREATVRVLDFGGDKLPPLLGGDERRGIELLLAHPEALRAQLRGIAAAAEAAEVGVRILLPLVRGVDDVRAVRNLLDRPAVVGAMIELPEAAAAAEELAGECEFLSIGTNDLTHATLGTDRFRAGAAPAHHPLVLRHVAAAIEAGQSAGIPVEVCGEAASDPLTVPLLVGLSADELSVGAARVGAVRAWVRALSHAEVAACSREALAAADAGEVERLVRPLAATLAEG